MLAEATAKTVDAHFMMRSDDVQTRMQLKLIVSCLRGGSGIKLY